MQHGSADHLNLAPPEQGRWLGPMGLALVVHGLLVAALTWGVGWQKDAPPVVFEAELWSRLPQEAAPRAVEPPPAPPALPEPERRVEPEPKPTPRPPVAQPDPAERQADIATALAKKKADAERREREEAAKRRAENDKLAAEKLAAEKKLAAERKVALDKAAAEKEREQKMAEQKREQERRQATEKREAELAKQQRDEQMRRIMGQAGASGGAESRGSAQQSSGPSPGYAGRVAARIKPNVVFTDLAPGNPRAEVEVRTLPDGTITSTKLVKSSGNAAWDDAVLRAIDRTGGLPRDTDGRVPPALIIGLRPQD